VVSHCAQHPTPAPYTPEINYTCPNTSVEVVVFTPNAVEIELVAGWVVYTEALRDNFTAVRTMFLSYIRCPNLLGFFYDGDGTNTFITTFDYDISYTDLEEIDLNYSTTMYWVACDAYNSPMLDAVTQTRPRKFAAGINALEIGPSDKGCGEAMQIAIRGSPLIESFWASLDDVDIPRDHWGFGGFGSDYFNSTKCP
jgi:hypothetical protein